jgi:hypothetical protein
MLYLPLVNTEFVIPAGEKRYEVTAEFISPFRATILNLLPHMHLLGQEIKLEITPPLGQPQTLIRIDDWDFDWQDTYWLENPYVVQPFSRLKLTCHFDNSATNPYNPHNPPIPVGWGPQTTDEMALVFIGFVLN